MRKTPPAPITLENVDWTQVFRTCVDGVNRAYQENYLDEDLQHYIYETALEAVYGKDIFAQLRRDKI